MRMGTLCYLERGDEVLMLHRVKKRNDMHRGFWVGLGGKFEAGESPEDCVRREVFEESGLTVPSPRLRAVLTFPQDIDGHDWYVFLFTADEFSGEMIESDEGDLAWVPRDALAQLPMHEGDRLFMRYLREVPGFFTAKLWSIDGDVQSELRVYG